MTATYHDGTVTPMSFSNSNSFGTGGDTERCHPWWLAVTRLPHSLRPVLALAALAVVVLGAAGAAGAGVFYHI